VPLFILRIPVRYYRYPPAYFRGWRSDAPPRWGDHWGRDWENRRSGWDRWNRRDAPRPASLPTYQRQYSGDRYPRQVERQHELHQQNYRYQPRDPVVRQHYQERSVQRAPEERGSRQQDIQRSTPRHQEAPATPRSQSPQGRDVEVQQSTPASPQPGRTGVQDQKPPPQPGAGQREPQVPGAAGQQESQKGKAATREPKPKREGKEQELELEREREREMERGRGRPQ